MSKLKYRDKIIRKDIWRSKGFLAFEIPNNLQFKTNSISLPCDFCNIGPHCESCRWIFIKSKKY